MLHTSTLLVFLRSHTINLTIAWCKSQVLENALSHHIISTLLSQQASCAKRKCTFQAFSVDTHSLSVYYSSDFQLQVPYWLPLFPGQQLNHDLCLHRAKRRLRISRVEREVEGMCVRIWEISVRWTQTERQESPLQFTTISNPESILLKACELWKD